MMTIEEVDAKAVAKKLEEYTRTLEVGPVPDDLDGTLNESAAAFSEGVLNGLLTMPTALPNPIDTVQWGERSQHLMPGYWGGLPVTSLPAVAQPIDAQMEQMAWGLLKAMQAMKAIALELLEKWREELENIVADRTVNYDRDMKFVADEAAEYARRIEAAAMGKS